MDGPGGSRSRARGTAEPVAVLNAAIEQMVQDAKAKALAKAAGGAGGAAAPPFLPAAAFQGRRPGYVFTTRRQGTGYYLDPLQPPPSGDDAEGDAAAGEDKPRAAPAEVLDPEELLRRAEEEANIDEVQALDARSLRRLATQLDKKARENLELRMKYAGEPMKFLENEVDLLSLVREVGQVAGSPELYPVLVDSPALVTLLGLLSHDNADLAVEVADVLMEMTDSDAVEDSAEEADALVEALLENNGLELMFQALSRFDESNEDEAAGVHKVLSTVEHMAEIKPAVAELVFERTGLLKWLLARVRRRTSDSNRLYASELLAILLQGHEANQRRLGAADGVDALLLAAAPYKGRDPADAEEEEYLENVFDSLCCCVMLPENRAAFVAAEGVELMFLLLKAKRSSRYGAVKALDFACTRCPPACDRFVEVGGLAPLFALFMGRAKVRDPRGEKASKDVAQEMEERSVSLISSLLQHVTKASLRDRVAAKFVEAEFEKVDMLVEVMFRYEDRVAAAEARLAPLFEAGELDEDDVMAEQLDAGLFTLQGCVVIASALWATGDVGLRKRLLALLHQRGRSLDMVREYLFEYYASLGDADADSAAAPKGSEGEGAKQRRRLAAFMEAVDIDTAAAEEERLRRLGVGGGGAAAAAGAEAGAAAGAAEGRGGGGEEKGERGEDVEMEVDEGEKVVNGSGGGGEAKAPAAAAAEDTREREGGGRKRDRSRSRSRERRRERSRSRERERRRDRSRSRERRRRSRSHSGDRSRRR